MSLVEVTQIVYLDETLCCGSRRCLPACNYGGLLHVPGERQPMVDPHACTGCGTCVSVCPQSALTLLGMAQA